jgi:hypothetical protein
MMMRFAAVHESVNGTSRRNGQLDFMSGFGRSSEADGCGGLARCNANDPERSFGPAARTSRN